MKLCTAHTSSLNLFVVLLAATTSLAVCSCRSTPVTGRRQLLLVPEKEEISQGLSAYQDVVSKEPPSTNRRYVELVNRVGRRIADVADRPDFAWEFRVIASPTQNAFCLPGGKVAVYEGIIPVCENEAGLAVVMSHEIAHALARHGGERLTQQRLKSFGQRGVNYVTQARPELEQKLILAAYGGASEYLYILPYSREHESEADHIGVLLMAKAGYDPTEAPKFWERFAGAKDGDEPPEFLSTHPSDSRRAIDLRDLLPDAKRIYDNTPTRHGLGETIK